MKNLAFARLRGISASCYYFIEFQPLFLNHNKIESFISFSSNKILCPPLQKNLIVKELGPGFCLPGNISLVNAVYPCPLNYLGYKGY
jgi:hypothetical protein